MRRNEILILPSVDCRMSRIRRGEELNFDSLKARANTTGSGDGVLLKTGHSKNFAQFSAILYCFLLFSFMCTLSLALPFFLFSRFATLLQLEVHTVSNLKDCPAT